MRLQCSSILYVTAITMILPPESGFISASRAKRQLAFRKGSSFFYRLNYKIASIPSSTIFAQATGFKVAWKLPSSGMEKRKRRSVADIHESTELLYDSHGFDGKACLAKNICQALDYIEGKEGVTVKILKLLIKEISDNGTYSALDKKVCEKYSARCPLKLVTINSFADPDDNVF